MKKFLNILVDTIQTMTFIALAISSYQGNILKCIEYLLIILVVEFVLKDKKNITIIKTDAVYLDDLNKAKGDENSGRE